MDNLLIQALRCEKTQRSPVWLMRQAGRYLQEYRDLKKRYSFLELCQNPELATQITLMPIEILQPDAAILFADILLILQTLGFSLRFGKDQGPLIGGQELLNDLSQLNLTSVREDLAYIPKTIHNLKQELKVPLLGFCGAPFTLATYVIEGRSSKDFAQTKQWIQNRPKALHTLLQLITDQTIDYLNMQIEAGVDALQIFDSWACFFSVDQLREFSFPYLKQILTALRKTEIPIILFAKGSCSFVEDLVALQPQAISLDSSGDLLEVAKKVPSHIALQGNLDPQILKAPLSEIEKEVKRLTYGMRNRPGYIVNLGHGIQPDSPQNAVQCLIDTVKNSCYSYR